MNFRQISKEFKKPWFECKIAMVTGEYKSISNNLDNNITWTFQVFDTLDRQGTPTQSLKPSLAEYKYIEIDRDKHNIIKVTVKISKTHSTMKLPRPSSKSCIYAPISLKSDGKDIKLLYNTPYGELIADTAGLKPGSVLECEFVIINWSLTQSFFSHYSIFNLNPGFFAFNSNQTTMPALAIVDASVLQKLFHDADWEARMRDYIIQTIQKNSKRDIVSTCLAAKRLNSTGRIIVAFYLCRLNKTESYLCQAIPTDFIRQGEATYLCEHMMRLIIRVPFHSYFRDVITDDKPRSKYIPWSQDKVEKEEDDERSDMQKQADSASEKLNRLLKRYCTSYHGFNAYGNISLREFDEAYFEFITSKERLAVEADSIIQETHVRVNKSEFEPIIRFMASGYSPEAIKRYISMDAEQVIRELIMQHLVIPRLEYKAYMHVETIRRHLFWRKKYYCCKYGSFETFQQMLAEFKHKLNEESTECLQKLRKASTEINAEGIQTWLMKRANEEKDEEGDVVSILLHGGYEIG